MLVRFQPNNRSWYVLVDEIPVHVDYRKKYAVREMVKRIGNVDFDHIYRNTVRTRLANGLDAYVVKRLSK